MTVKKIYDIIRNNNYVIRNFISTELCRFCLGRGFNNCIKYEEEKLCRCSNDKRTCVFCDGSGISHQIF